MKLKAMLLPAMLVVLIASTVVVHVVMLVVAARDPSFAVTEDSDRDATWARRVRQRQENDRLGWTVEATARAPSGRGAPALLAFEIDDADGAALRGATVEIEAFHKARPHQVIAAPLGERGPGRYVGVLAAPRPGVWRVALSVQRGDERYVDAIDLDVPAAAGSDGEAAR